MPQFADKMSFLSDTELEPDTLKWMEGIKPSLRPVTLSRDYPRVANKIAFLWSEPELMHRFFNDVMMNTDPGRKGFSPEAVLELGSLRHLYDKLHPTPTDPWHKATVMADSGQ